MRMTERTTAEKDNKYIALKSVIIYYNKEYTILVAGEDVRKKISQEEVLDKLRVKNII